jgi:hypothetical protein
MGKGASPEQVVREIQRRTRRWISRTTCSVLAPLPIGCLLLGWAGSVS